MRQQVHSLCEAGCLVRGDGHLRAREAQQAVESILNTEVVRAPAFWTCWSCRLFLHYLGHVGGSTDVGT
jgi:hypothetical protein